MRSLLHLLPYSDLILFLLIASFVFLSRVPFLDAGYGNDADAWRVVNAARHIATTGEYTASRFPGYPLQEIALSLVWDKGPRILNGITAVLSGVGCAFFALSLKSLNVKHWVMGSLALAFTEVIFVHSVDTMDYIWALAFLLGALYLVLIERPLIAGVFVGAAIGCRITSGAMLLPLSLMLFDGASTRDDYEKILGFILAALSAGLAFFVPVILTYGLDFWFFVEHGYPSFPRIVRMSTVGLWGKVGTCWIMVLAISVLIWPKRQISDGIPREPVSGLWVASWILAVVLYLISFLRLPHDSGYLIPVIPFVLIMVSKVASRVPLFIIYVLIIISPFISFDGLDVCAGGIFVDHSRRLATVEYIDRVIVAAGHLESRSVVVSGPYLPFIKASLKSGTQQGVKYEYALNASQVDEYVRQEWELYYLRGRNDYNIRIRGVDLVTKGAKPLSVSE